MFRTIIKYLQLGLDLLAAEPGDVETIRALQVQVSTLNAELAAARSAKPTDEEQKEIDQLLGSFAQLEARQPVEPERYPPMTAMEPVAALPPVEVPAEIPDTDLPVPEPERYPAPEMETDPAPEVETAPTEPTPES